MISRRLTIPPEASALLQVNDWLDETCRDAGLESDVADDIKLCVSEAVTNVILYAFADIAEPILRIEIEADADGIRATIIDNGPPFNPLVWPRKERFTDLESAVPGGFGIQLVRDTADEVEYERTAGENRLHIECRVGERAAVSRA